MDFEKHGLTRQTRKTRFLFSFSLVFLFVNNLHDDESIYRIYFFYFYLVHFCDRPTKGGCDHFCNKTDNHFTCACKEGFKLTEDGKTCIRGKVAFLRIPSFAGRQPNPEADGRRRLGPRPQLEKVFLTLRLR